MRLVFKIVLSEAIYTAIVSILYIIGRWVFRKFASYSWYVSGIYTLLKNLESDFPLIYIVGLLIILLYHLRKTLSYIDDVIDASSKLVEDDEEEIHLPKALEEIEEKMNLVKVQSRHHHQQAIEAVERKNDLIVYLAHDIKTPLTSMIGYLSLLEEIDDMPKKKREKYIHIALEKSYHLEDLINELFEITRYNSEDILLEKEELNLNLMLEQIADDFYPILEANHKKIELSLEPNVTVYADSFQLARVFNNVIKNAIAYSKEETSIRIESRMVEDKVEVVVINQGKTIPSEKLEKIFERFYRVDASRGTSLGGSGLGLAIAKEIVELHEGKIYATSDSKDTRFYIELPRMEN